MRTRWEDPKGISDLSIAVDEIYFLRALLADEADVLEAHLDYKTFPKTRRKYAEEQLDRMRRAAKGEMYAAARERFDAPMAFRRLGVKETLTNHDWAEQRGLIEESASE